MSCCLPGRDSNTLRILELDGGGMRGYLSIQFLKRLVEQWGIESKDLGKYFDVICGTSIGGIMTLGIAAGNSLDDIERFFTEKGPDIFTVLYPVPSITPNAAAKIALAAINTPFYQSSGAFENNYGSGLLYATIRELLPTQTLQNLNTNVLIPSVQLDDSVPDKVKYTFVTFSNIKHPEFIGQNALASDIALSTSAAPLYLPVYSWGGYYYIDGGVYQNNPAIFGRNLAQIIKPGVTRTCILSVGTGLGAVGFSAEGEPPPPPPPVDPVPPGGDPSFFVSRKNALTIANNQFDAPSSTDLLMQLFTLASTGGQESVARSLYLESEYAANKLYYYRFQPLLDPNINTELDASNGDTLAYYRQVANNWYDNDTTNITNFLGHLTR